MNYQVWLVNRMFVHVTYKDPCRVHRFLDGFHVPVPTACLHPNGECHPVSGVDPIFAGDVLPAGRSGGITGHAASSEPAG